MLIEILNSDIKEPLVLAETISKTSIGVNEIYIDQPLWDDGDEEAIFRYGIIPNGTDLVLQVLKIGKRLVGNVLVDYVLLRNNLTEELPMHTNLLLVNLMETISPGINFSVTKDSYRKNNSSCWVRTECDGVNEYGTAYFSGNILSSEVSEYNTVATTVLTHLDDTNRTISFDSTNLDGVIAEMILDINGLKYTSMRVDNGVITLSSPLPPLSMAKVSGTVNKYLGDQTDDSVSFVSGTPSNSHNHNYTSPNVTTDVNNQDHTHVVGGHKHGLTGGTSIIPYKEESFTPIQNSYIEINGLKYEIASVDDELKEITIYGNLQATVYDDNIIYSNTYPPNIPIKAALWRTRSDFSMVPITASGFGLFRVAFKFSEIEGDTTTEDIDIWFFRTTPSCVVQDLDNHKYRIHLNMVNLEVGEEYKINFPKGLQDYFQTQNLMESESFKAGDNNNE